MKKLTTRGAAALLIGMAATSTALADITVNTPGLPDGRTFEVKSGYISDLTKPRMQRPDAMVAEYKVVDGKFVIPTLDGGAARYMIPTGAREYVMIYTQPGEDINVTIESTEPLAYSVTGTRLMEDIAAMDAKSAAIMRRAQQIMATGNADPAAMESLQNEYDTIFTDFIAANPGADAVPYAVMNLEGQKFLDAYNAVGQSVKNSPLLPFMETQKQYVDRAIAAEQRKAQLQSGDYPAPDFTFNTIDGKSVSLSDFRGKWVIIDFWGSWCPWCIKGFPKLKETYAQYKPELEVLGVACNDKREAWENALKKYELPWVNVYNPEDGGGAILADYAVEGFPTKVIVSPDGKIKNITSGENPEFFEILAKLIKK